MVAGVNKDLHIFIWILNVSQFVATLLIIAFYSALVTTLRPTSPGFATWRRGPIGVFCHFCHLSDFGNFLGIVLAHFDSWTICDNSLQ